MYTKYDACGHYLEISEEDGSRYDTVLAHGLMLASHHGAYHIADYLIKQGTKVNSANKVSRNKIDTCAFSLPIKRENNIFAHPP